MRLTVGPLPPAVYWRRRALVLGVVLLGLFLVAQACMAAAASRGEGPEPTAPPDTPPPPSTGSPATADSSAEEQAGEQLAGSGGDEEPAGEPDAELCTDEEMRITATADPDTAPGGAGIELRITIRNDSDRHCRRDIGGSERELYLRNEQGAGKVWSSRDCADLSGSNVQELSPGFETSHYAVWNGRSSDACDQSGQPAGDQLPAGEYELVARLGSAYSKPVIVTVT